jgi:outer membrane protein TolC
MGVFIPQAHTAKVWRHGVIVLAAVICFPHLAAARDWDLRQSLQRAREVSPALDSERGRIKSRQAALDRADRWPNPTASAEAGTGLAEQLGEDGVRLQEYGVRQPIPISGRLQDRERAASRQLRASESAQANRGLIVEERIARLYRRLQAASDRVKLLTSQLDQAERFRRIAHERAAEGDVSQREADRLAILVADLDGRRASARRQRDELKTQFRKRLDLPRGATVSVPTLAAPAEPAPLAQLRQRLDQHPALEAAQQRARAATARVDEARAERLPDLNVRLTQENAAIGGSTEPVYEVGLSMEIPLWRPGEATVDERQGEAIRARGQRNQRRLERREALATQHQAVSRLLQRLADHRRQVLEPARAILGKTEEGYLAGEIDLTEFIDVARENWRAERKELDILARLGVRNAALRRATGRALVTNKTTGASSDGS